jgi:hypothetical protein
MRSNVMGSVTLTRKLMVATCTLLFCSGAADAEIIGGRPDVIVCSVRDPTEVLPWEALVFYVSARMNDGRTLYKTLTSDPVVLLVNAEGVVEGPNLANCDQYPIDRLYAEGRARLLSVSPPDHGSQKRDSERPR